MGLFSLFARNDAVYMPDSTTLLKHREGYELYLKIFAALGIPVKLLEKQLFSGREAWEAGYEQTARTIARDNFDFLKGQKVTKIITNSPECYKMLAQTYKQLIPDWDIPVENIWEILLKKLEKRPSLVKVSARETITYHDNCYLGRYCKVYEEPRAILKLLGYDLREMDNTKENSFCCGSCGGLTFVDPELADNLARERLLQAKRIGVTKMVVCSFDNYNLLQKQSEKAGVTVLELSHVLARALGITVQEQIEEISNENNIIEDNKLTEVITENE
ncbi:MAG: iron-sulfur-binding reductase [archaeon]|jgi:Fe-S oxidoreductase